MNGIKLKSNKMSLLQVERVKWISLMVLSHFLSFLFMSTPTPSLSEELSPIREGYLRLRIQLNNHIPLGKKPHVVLIMTNKKEIISRDVTILKKVASQSSIDGKDDEYLIELPEDDLPKMIQAKEDKLHAYPSSKKIKNLNEIKRSKDYEIHF